MKSIVNWAKGFNQLFVTSVDTTLALNTWAAKYTLILDSERRKKQKHKLSSALTM